MATGFTQQPTAINITDTSVTISATVETMTVPVWSTIPDITVDALDMPHQVNLTPYVTSQTPITAWGADVGTVVDGVWTVTTATTVGVHTVNVTADNQAGQGAGSFQLTVTVTEYLHNFDTAADGGFTPARASDATVHNQLANIITVTDDVEAYPGGNYVPPWQDESVGYGIQLEEERTNVVQGNSQDVLNAWNRTRVTVTNDGEVGPLGGATSRIVPDTAANNHYVYVECSVTTGVEYTQTWVVKPDGLDWVQITGSSGFDGLYTNVNIATLATGNTDGLDVTVANAGSGWAVIKVTATANATGLDKRFVLAPIDDDYAGRLPAWSGDDVAGILHSHTQMEAGAFPTSYIPSPAFSSTTRAATNLSAPFSALSPLPAGGVVNDFCVQITCRLATDLSDYADGARFCTLYATDDNDAVVVYKHATADTIGVDTVRGGVATTTTHAAAGLTAGTVVDIRLRKSSAGMSVSHNGGAFTNNPTDTAAMAAAISNVAEGASAANGNHLSAEYQITRIVPAALSDEEITAWEGWTEPLPIITQQPSDIDFGGTTPEPGAGPVFTNQPISISTNEPEGACFTVWVQDMDYDYMEWQSDLSGDWRPVREDFPTAMSLATNLDGVDNNGQPNDSMDVPADCDFMAVGIPQVKEGQNCQFRCMATNADGTNYSNVVTLTVGPRLTFAPERPNCLYERHTTYLGSFTIPKESATGGGRDAGYSGNAMAIADNGAAMYLGCRNWDEAGDEGGGRYGYGKISIPDVGGEAGWLIDSEYMIYDKTYGHNYDGGSEYVRGGLVWGNDIILTPCIWYDNSADKGYTAFSVSLDLQTWGPMRTADYLAHNSKKPFVNGFMCHVPPEWQATIGWPTLVGNSHMSIASGCPNGFSVWGFHPDQLLATSGLENKYPIEPFMAHELGLEAVARTWKEMHHTGWRNPGNCPPPNTVWQAGDDVCGMCWPEGTDTILMVGTVGTGQNTYKIKGETSSGSGRAAEPYRRQIWAFDAKDFMKVKDGEIQRHEVQPYARWPLPDEIQDPASEMLEGGMTYDPVLRRIYWCSQYKERPEVHVIQVEEL